MRLWHIYELEGVWQEMAETYF